MDALDRLSSCLISRAQSREACESQDQKKSQAHDCSLLSRRKFLDPLCLVSSSSGVSKS
jgi:hypothetical protein